MAPEQMKSSRDVDTRADIWALGTILYELLAGAPPFTGQTIPEVCIAVMAAVPRPITTFRTDIPPQLQGIILKCLSRLPRDRYVNVATLARDLARFAGARSTVHAERASAMMRSALADKPLSVHPDDGVPLSRDHPRPELHSSPDGTDSLLDSLPSLGGTDEAARRRRRTMALAFAIGIVALVLIGGFVTRRTSAPSDPAAGPASPVSAPSPEIPLATSAPEPNAPTIATVPFDQLPHVPTFPSGHPLATSARAPVAPSTASASPHATHAPSSAVKPSAAPHPVSPSSSSPSDDWKWGDRN
jgi:eukaryotic-like serine/threonine-protein kinase